jgi:hypothetical protein
VPRTAAALGCEAIAGLFELPGVAIIEFLLGWLSLGGAAFAAVMTLLRTDSSLAEGVAIC